MQLHKLALALQEGSEGRYIYGQDDSAPETSPQGQEVSNGHHATMRRAQDHLDLPIGGLAWDVSTQMRFC